MNWDWNGLKIKKLRVPMRAHFLFTSKMIGHPDLGFLREFAIKGRVRVDIIGETETDKGKLYLFNPTDKTSVQRCALEENFVVFQPQKLKP